MIKGTALVVTLLILRSSTLVAHLFGLLLGWFHSHLARHSMPLLGGGEKMMPTRHFLTPRNGPESLGPVRFDMLVIGSLCWLAFLARRRRRWSVYRWSLLVRRPWFCHMLSLIYSRTRTSLRCCSDSCHLVLRV